MKFIVISSLGAQPQRWGGGLQLWRRRLVLLPYQVCKYQITGCHTHGCLRLTIGSGFKLLNIPILNIVP